MHKEVMTIDEVAAYLRLGRRVVYRLAQQGELPGRKIANRWRFHLRDVENWVRCGPANDTVPAAASSEIPTEECETWISQKPA